MLILLFADAITQKLADEDEHLNFFTAVDRSAGGSACSTCT
jgi:hypothetical protein